MKNFLCTILIIANVKGFAQTDSTTSALSFSAYIDIYYSYDFGKPADHNRPAFYYSFNRSNEINLNIGLAKVAYNTEKLRANLAFMAGTYTNANLAAEKGVLKNIYEANAGVKISRKKNLWIDAGIFPSHIGFESALSKDCWNLTRSILADNSPYYESGAKLSYTSNNRKWFISALLLNGWQRIQRVDGNHTLAFGHQLIFKPNDALTVNSSSFIGNDKPDSVKQMRYFHNLYGIFQITKKFGITTGVDIGAEQQSKGSHRYNSWYSPVMIVQIKPAAKHQIAARVEYYSDKYGVMISTGTPNGFNTWGYSLNYDYLIRDNVMWRIEGRSLISKDKIFEKYGKPENDNFFLTTSLSINF
ncbi:MAG: porin [Bacteroidetes bacterium]|nr:porin [Bacteroidota bacterium]